MALNQFGAGFLLQGRDMASPVIKRVGASFMGLNKTVQTGAMGMGKALGSLAIGFGALKIGQGMMGMAKATADAAGKFEQGLAGVAAVSRATVEEQLMLHDKALASAMKSQYSPDQAIEGLTNLATAGLKAKEQIEVLDPVLNLAAGSMGQLGLGDAANAVVGTVKSMGYEVGRATEVTDKLLKITQLTNFQTRDFSIGLSRATATAKIYGQSLDDALIQMGLLRNMNIEASVASTSLREAWRRLATDQKGQQALQKQGVQVFDEQTKKVRPMLDVMSELAVKTKDLDDKERMRLATVAFGIRGMAAYNAVAEASQTIMVDGIAVNLKGIDAINAMRMELMEQGKVLDENTQASLKASLGIEDLSAVMKSSTGTAEAFRKKLLDTYEGQKQLITGAKEAVAVVTGEAAAKLFKPIAAGVFMVLSKLAEFLNSIPPEARQVLIGVVSALGSLIAMAGGILLLQGVMNMLGLSFGGIAITLGKFLLVAAPVMVLMTGLGIGIYALYRAFNSNAQGIGLSWKDMVDRIKTGWQVITAVVKGEDFSKALKKNIEKLGMEGFVKKFENFWGRMQALWKGIKQGFEVGVAALADSPAFARLRQTMSGVISLFTGTEMTDSQAALKGWEERGKAAGMKLASLGEIAADVLNKMIELGQGFMTFMKNVDASDIESGIHNLVDAFRTLWDILNVVKTAFMGIYNTVKLVVSVVWESFRWIIRLIEAVGDLWALPGSKHTLDEWRDFYKDKLVGGQAFNWTTAAAGDLADTFTSEADRLAQRDESARTRGNREVQAQQRLINLDRLRGRKREIEEWVNMSAEKFHEKYKGTAAEGNLAFGEAPLEMQRQFLKELENVSKSIEKLAKSPVTVNIDGEKAAEILGRQPSFSGEDSLDDSAPVFVP